MSKRWHWSKRRSKKKCEETDLKPRVIVVGQIHNVLHLRKRAVQLQIKVWRRQSFKDIFSVTVCQTSGLS